MASWKEMIARQIDIKSIIATTLSYFFIPRWFTYKILGASHYTIHKTRIRDAMHGTRWYEVMTYYDWTCASCGRTNYRNRDQSTPKMEVDHINPVYRWGENNWDNLQVLCKRFNLLKGIKYIDYRSLKRPA